MSLKTDKRVIDALNQILTGELTAINQYFLHAKMCQNWGYERLYKVIYRESIDEMKHADALIERILYLGGLPNVQRLDKVNIGETVAEQLLADLSFEQVAIPRLKTAIELCYTCSDHGTRHLLEEILHSEEEHVDWLETQLELIDQLGTQNYLAQQLRE
jgi:bacterioferritin